MQCTDTAKAAQQRVVRFRKVVADVGGYSEVARRLGVSLSTCHGWARRGRVPAWRIAAIAALAPVAERGARHKRVR